MPSTFIKATRVASQSLGLLLRELSLPNLVWRDAAGDFAGAAGDTISIRVPAYTTARTRVLRSGSAITMDDLAESVVNVTLNTDVYKAVAISDEQLTLDIANFGAQVMDPVVRSVAMGVEDAIAAQIAAAPYVTTIEVANAGTQDVYDALVDARKALNNANVPQSGRIAVLGSNLEARALKSPNMVKVSESGSDGTLRDATIGRMAGFDIVISNAVAPNYGYVFHRTAFVLSMRAPVVPDGAAWGASQSYQGLAMRVLRDYDFVNVRDRLLADTYIGTNYVPDVGSLDANGKFVANDTVQGTPLAVTGVASTDIFTTATHGYAAGDRVAFSALTGGTGITLNQTYYVIATNLTATTFSVSATPGGAILNFTSDVTATSTVVKGGATLFVRGVRLTDIA